MTYHHVDVFQDDDTKLWGWQCFTCGAETTGLPSLFDGDELAEDHRHKGCQRCNGTGSIRIEGGMPDEVVYDECPACAA